MPAEPRRRDHNPDVSAARKHPRYAHEAELTLVVGAQRIRGTTANLSRGGLAGFVDAAVRVGTPCEVELALMFDEGALSEPLHLAARIVWCTAMEKRHQVGLAYAALDPEQLQILEVFLRFLDEGAAIRRAR